MKVRKLGGPTRIRVELYRSVQNSEKWQTYVRDRSAINENGCWIWQKNISPTGYGQGSIKREAARAHRISYSAFRGDPGKLLVLHNCHVKACVNPNHLRLGDQRDNILDAIAVGAVKPIPLEKSRRPGELHGRAKLNNTDIEKIFALKQNGLFQREIAAVMKISRSHISNILRGANWRHLR